MEKIIQIAQRQHLATNGFGRKTVQGGLFALTESGHVYFMEDNSDSWEKLPPIVINDARE